MISEHQRLPEPAGSLDSQGQDRPSPAGGRQMPLWHDPAVRRPQRPGAETTLHLAPDPIHINAYRGERVRIEPVTNHRSDSSLQPPYVDPMIGQNLHAISILLPQQTE